MLKKNKKNIEDLVNHWNESRRHDSASLQKEKGFSFFIIVMILFIASVSGAGYYGFHKKKEKDNLIQKDKQQSISALITSNDNIGNNQELDEDEEDREEDNMKKTDSPSTQNNTTENTTNNKPPHKSDVSEDNENSIIDKNVDILVLNGGGVVGAASTLKNVLTGKGFTKVEIGNASSSNHTGLVVYFQDGKNVHAEKVVKTLKQAKYTVTKTESLEKLSKNITSEVVIIIGK